MVTLVFSSSASAESRGLFAPPDWRDLNYQDVVMKVTSFQTFLP